MNTQLKPIINSLKALALTLYLSLLISPFALMGNEESYRKFNDRNSDWLPIYKGVSYRLEIQENPESLKIHQLRIDLEDPHVAFMTTPPRNEDAHGTTAMKPSSFLKKHSLQVVVNGAGYYPTFNEDEGAPKDLGVLAIFEGNKYSYFGSEDVIFTVFNDGKAKVLSREEFQNTEEEAIKMALGGCGIASSSGWLVQEGEVNPNIYQDEENARTALGISEDEKALYLVVVEGGPRSGFFFKDIISTGCYLDKLAHIMKNLGCFRAMNLDGGGASTMVLQNDKDREPIRLNIPSDYRKEEERSVGSHLGIYANPLSLSKGEENPVFQTLQEDAHRALAFKNRLSEEGLADAFFYEDTCPSWDSEENCPSFSSPFELEDNLLSLESLNCPGAKQAGASEGSVCRDSNELVWFIKRGQSPQNEYLGTRFMNLLLGIQAPKVKLIKEQPGFTGARQMLGFIHAEDLDDQSGVNITGEVELAIAMDFIGLHDRHGQNMGYLRKKAQDLTAVRVDYDRCFFADDDDAEEFGSSDHKDKTLFLESLQNYKWDEIQRAIENIVDFPDEQITYIWSEAYVLLSEYYPGFKANRFSQLPQQLVERKQILMDLLPDVRYVNPFLEKSSFGDTDENGLKEAQERLESIFGDLSVNLLHIAALHGNKALVRYLLSNREGIAIDPNIQDHAGRTALTIAFERGYFDIVELLIKEKTVDVNKPEHRGNTLLHKAVDANNFSWVKKLVEEFNVEIDVPNMWEETPLLLALLNNNLDVLMFLMGKGANEGKDFIHSVVKGTRDANFVNSVLENLQDYNLEMKDVYGKTPIMHVTNPAVFDLLVAKGSDTTVTDSDGNTILHNAAQGSNASFIKYLLNECQGCNFDLNAKNNSGKTPIMMSYLPKIQELLIPGTDPREMETDYFGNTFLHNVIRNDNARLVKAILNTCTGSCFDELIEAKNNNDETPLFVAYSTEIAKILIAQGANPKITNRFGDTLLHGAARQEDASLTKYLLNECTACNFDLEAKNNAGETPLMVVNNPEIMEVLISKGADTTVTYGGTDNTLLHKAAGHWDASLVKFLLNDCADCRFDTLLEVKNNAGQTPLMVVRAPESMEVLISKGADTTVTYGDTGNTLLHKAADQGDTSLVQFLLNECADCGFDTLLEVKNNAGETPLMVVSLWEKEIMGILTAKINGKP